MRSRMIRRHRTPLLWVGMLLLAFLLSGCASGSGANERADKGQDATGDKAEPVRLILDWYPNADHAGLYMAVAKGYFEEEGIDLRIEIPSDPSTALRQVAAGQAEAAISYETEVLLARSQDLPVASIMELVQRPLHSIITLDDSGIRTPADLLDRKIGTPGTAASDAMLQTILKQAEVPSARVEAINVGYDLVPMLLANQLDAVIGAYWNVEGVEVELRGYSPHILRVDEWGVPRFAELVVVASETFLEQRPDVARRFLSAFVRGQEEAIQNPSAAAEAIMEANKEMDPELVRRGVDLLVPVLADEQDRVGWHDLDEWKDYADWMKESGLFDHGTVPDVRQAARNEFLPQ